MKMKSIVVLLFLIILSSSFCSYAEEQEFDFKRVKWGMSKEEVKEAETLPLTHESEDDLWYRNVPDMRTHMNVDLGYSFNEGKLEKAVYFLSFDYPHAEAYVYDFEHIKSNLLEEYGEPALDKVVWLNEFYKDKEEYLGYALEKGLVEYWVIWETSTTSILLNLYKSSDVLIMLAFHNKENS